MVSHQDGATRLAQLASEQVHSQEIINRWKPGSLLPMLPSAELPETNKVT
jgi:hypothetical protein